MAESLEEFLNIKKSNIVLPVSGSLQCQECNEIVAYGELDDETMILTYTCTKKHESKVKI